MIGVAVVIGLVGSEGLAVVFGGLAGWPGNGIGLKLGFCTINGVDGGNGFGFGFCAGIGVIGISTLGRTTTVRSTVGIGKVGSAESSYPASGELEGDGLREDDLIVIGRSVRPLSDCVSSTSFSRIRR